MRPRVSLAVVLMSALVAAQSHAEPPTPRTAADSDLVRATRVEPLAVRPKTNLAHIVEDVPGPTEEPGWFQAQGKTGYGWRNAETQTMFGVYGRPPMPLNLGPKAAPEGKDAAGMSVSVTLGTDLAPAKDSDRP